MVKTCESHLKSEPFPQSHGRFLFAVFLFSLFISEVFIRQISVRQNEFVAKMVRSHSKKISFRPFHPSQMALEGMKIDRKLERKYEINSANSDVFIPMIGPHSQAHRCFHHSEHHGVLGTVKPVNLCNPQQQNEGTISVFVVEFLIPT